MYPLRGTQLGTEYWRLTSWILLSVSRLKSTSIRFYRQCFPLVLENLQLYGFVGKLSPFVLENLQKVAPSDLLRVLTTGLHAVYFYAHSKRKRSSSKLWPYQSQLNANGPITNVHNSKWMPICLPEWSMCLPVNRTDSIGFPLLKRALIGCATRPTFWNVNSTEYCTKRSIFMVYRYAWITNYFFKNVYIHNALPNAVSSPNRCKY